MFKWGIISVIKKQVNKILLLFKCHLIIEASRDISLSLYQFLCPHIVGTEETVKTKNV